MAIGKAITLSGWIFGIASFVVEMPPQVQSFGRGLFWFLLVAHIVECGVFFSVLKRAGGSLGSHIFQTMVFGLFHVRGLPADASESVGGA